MLSSIVYISEMASPYGADMIERLSKKGQYERSRFGLTGILFCYSEHFIEILEGVPDAVATIYDRIKRDQRHRRVTLVQDTVISARSYDHWSVRFVNKERLTEAERAMVLHALHVIEPRTVLAPKTGRLEDDLGMAMIRIMAHAVPAQPNDCTAAETIDDLLFATELCILRSNTIAELAFETIVYDAKVTPAAAQKYFRTVDDLVRTCVLRVLALKHQKFLGIVASIDKDDPAAYASAITDFITRINSKFDGLSAEMSEHIFNVGRQFISETAWILAEGIIAQQATRQAPNFLSLDRLAMAIIATDAAGHALGQRYPDKLTNPATNQLLRDICMSALTGREKSGYELR